MVNEASCVQKVQKYCIRTSPFNNCAVNCMSVNVNYVRDKNILKLKLVCHLHLNTMTLWICMNLNQECGIPTLLIRSNSLVQAAIKTLPIPLPTGVTTGGSSVFLLWQSFLRQKPLQSVATPNSICVWQANILWCGINITQQSLRDFVHYWMREHGSSEKLFSDDGGEWQFKNNTPNTS